MLELETSGFQGPIPPSISLLRNLTELRISDLNGGASEFPHLGEMTGMRSLMLRSCNIVGKIPDDIANMATLKNLDLSFNNLEGEIPNLDSLAYMETMYLTSNNLSGPIPDWIKNKDAKYQIDLSNNNFSVDSEPSNCQGTLNLYRSTNDGNPLEQTKCLESFPCSKEFAPPPKGKKKIYIVVGFAAAMFVIILTILGTVWRKWYTKNKISKEKEGTWHLNLLYGAI